MERYGKPEGTGINKDTVREQETYDKETSTAHLGEPEIYRNGNDGGSLNGSLLENIKENVSVYVAEELEYINILDRYRKYY